MQLAALGNALGGATGVATDAVGDQLSQAPTGAAPLSQGNFWARGFGQFGSVDNNGGALGADYSTGGGAIGADLIRTPDHLLGLAAGGGHSSVSLNTNAETGSVSFVQFGVYGAQALGSGFALDGAGAYAHDYYDVTRGIFLPGTSRSATSSHGGNDEVLDVGLSRPFAAEGWQVTPRVGLSYYHIDQAAFTESGAGSLDLAVNPGALDALFSRIGFAIAQPMTFGGGDLLPELRAAWLHNFLDNAGAFNASFIGTGAGSFNQVGAAVGRDAADLGAGVSFAISQTSLPGHMTGFVQYDATVASHATANAVAAGLRLNW
jgi:outer membrane autotransporter protein